MSGNCVTNSAFINLANSSGESRYSSTLLPFSNILFHNSSAVVEKPIVPSSFIVALFVKVEAAYGVLLQSSSLYNPSSTVIKYVNPAKSVTIIDPTKRTGITLLTLFKTTFKFSLKLSISYPLFVITFYTSALNSIVEVNWSFHITKSENTKFSIFLVEVYLL